MLWALKSLVVSITPTRRGKTIASLLVHLLFPLRYLDRLLIDRKSAWESASLFYFMGRKSDRTLSDRELIEMYSR